MRRRWLDIEWIDRFGYTVSAFFGLSIIGLVACAAMNDDPSPTLPSMPLASYVTTTTVTSTTILDCGAQVPADDCADGPGISPPSATLLSSQSP